MKSSQFRRQSLPNNSKVSRGLLTRGLNVYLYHFFLFIFFTFVFERRGRKEYPRGFKMQGFGFHGLRGAEFMPQADGDPNQYIHKSRRQLLLYNPRRMVCIFLQEKRMLWVSPKREIPEIMEKMESLCSKYIHKPLTTL